MARPLEDLRREHRRRDRAPYLHNPHKRQPVDVIDRMDTSFPVPWHHGGPYDACLASRNRDPKTSPAEAVKDSTMEALKATPIEFIQDSLKHHIPLHGVACIPSGSKDFQGRTMCYEEGSDLMREADAEGGAYRRWDHTDSDNLKSKGEPSYAIKCDLKARAKAKKATAADVEMRPLDGKGARSRASRRDSSRSPVSMARGMGRDDANGKCYGGRRGGVRRRNSTSKKITDT